MGDMDYPGTALGPDEVRSSSVVEGAVLPLPRLRAGLGAAASHTVRVEKVSPPAAPFERHSRSIASAFLIQARPPKAAYAPPQAGEVPFIRDEMFTRRYATSFRRRNSP
jgi:hypothetical protein